jgi:squalene-hopene/tetraprenyl-beta-curcumene cyclase
VASIALATVDRQEGGGRHEAWVQNGCRWLSAQVNPDGGWGDTIRSASNLSTTALGWAAMGMATPSAEQARSAKGAAEWIGRHAGSLDQLVEAIRQRYGADRTFSVPILLTLALSGRLGNHGWEKVPPLPFELAALPRSWFGALRLPVVSYALPALIALGQAIHYHAPSRYPWVRALRGSVAGRTLKLLEELQPPNGGFLEAVPLTAFVTMSLASIGAADHPVTRRGAGFLRGSARADGSWPIDSNLSTWVTTLAVKSLAHQPGAIDPHLTSALREWLLKQQFRAEHPYTGAAPGGWAWTDLPGGVPDADDTAGALLALEQLTPTDSAAAPDALAAASHGVEWLLSLQNRDGGIPTFCRGWGTLPFDRSAPELTGHALRAWAAWARRFPPALQHRIEAARARAVRFLRRAQRPDGSWVPLWFGNERAPGEENPVYGTAQVLMALCAREFAGEVEDLRLSAAGYLGRVRNPDGGWGGGPGASSSVEETSLAVAALSEAGAETQAMQGGVCWLVEVLAGKEWPAPSPIGLYFARLWYFERLYPLIFAADALGRVCGTCGWDGDCGRPGT